MYNLKAIIFEDFFAKFFTVDDYNKESDPDKKGFLQRYVETLAEDIDETVILQASMLLDNTLIPSTVKDKFIPYLEKMVGVSPIIADLAIRRRVLVRILDIWRTKGTLASYQLIFRALGFDNVEITKAGVDFGFDSAVTLDNEVRTFDLGKCHKCQYYSLNLIGDVVITNEMYDAIRAAVKEVEPIYCRLFEVTLNGVDVNLLTIFIEDNGDLIYNTLSEGLVGFTLNANGDLIIHGANASLYTLDNNGNFIYNG